jgi:hypothetical protein
MTTSYEQAQPAPFQPQPSVERSMVSSRQVDLYGMAPMQYGASRYIKERGVYYDMREHVSYVPTTTTVMKPVVTRKRVQYRPVKMSEIRANPHLYEGRDIREFEVESRIIEDMAGFVQGHTGHAPSHAKGGAAIGVLGAALGIMPIQAHEMEEWRRTFNAHCPGRHEQEFDQSVTEAVFKGIRKLNEYDEYIRKEWSKK